jgi:TfoX/Sxy family transcriptional regulator of competence genes
MSPGRTSRAAQSRRAGRRRMPHIAAEMKAWSAALEAEVGDWPRVTRKPMFGLMAFYRGEHIFAILPRTRALGSASSLAFKLEKATPRILATIEREPRIQTTIMKARRWYLFELSADSDLREALAWLRQAYEAAT